MGSGGWDAPNDTRVELESRLIGDLAGAVREQGVMVPVDVHTQPRDIRERRRAEGLVRRRVRFLCAVNPRPNVARNSESGTSGSDWLPHHHCKVWTTFSFTRGIC